ncbi:MAG: Undecaprenyl-phosphate galactose phosphotransferase [Pedosphaera sp.]|nr:Undecaprenyl-phosphate galactose phosphotransferase [Pedosphaera sp.]
MTEEEIRSQLIWRFTIAQRPLGRWRLNTYVLWKRVAWKAVVGSTLFVKRGFDIVVSFILLLILSPIFLVAAILVKMDGGPAFLTQFRVGKHGREFKMYKFRSMVVNADQVFEKLRAQNQHEDGVTFKMKNDPRITKVGKWLRKFSVDELPQFLNVFIGDMSLVGPRPCLPREVALYTLEQRRRLEVLPGITCFWQIGGRAEIDFSGQVQLDVRYIESHTFWGDVKILFKTVPAVLFGKGAY